MMHCRFNRAVRRNSATERPSLCSTTARKLWSELPASFLCTMIIIRSATASLQLCAHGSVCSVVACSNGLPLSVSRSSLRLQYCLWWRLINLNYFACTFYSTPLCSVHSRKSAIADGTDACSSSSGSASASTSKEKKKVSWGLIRFAISDSSFRLLHCGFSHASHVSFMRAFSARSWRMS